MNSPSVAVNAHLYLMAPVDTKADFSQQRLVAFLIGTDPRLASTYRQRAISLIPQTPRQVNDDPRRLYLAGSTGRAPLSPFRRATGSSPEIQSANTRGETP